MQAGKKRTGRLDTRKKLPDEMQELEAPRVWSQVRRERFSQRCSVRLQADRPQVRLKPDTTYYGVVKSAVTAFAKATAVKKPETRIHITAQRGH